METPLLKIDSIRRCLARVSEMAALNPTLMDQNNLDVVVLNLQRACEQSLDLANWLCAYRNLSIPRTSREVFTILENGGILPANLALSMRRMIGFRNIAVHEYQQLDPAIVRSIVFNRLGDFEELIKCVSQNLNIQAPGRFIFSLSNTPRDIHRIFFLSIESINFTGDDLGNDFQLDLIGHGIFASFKLTKQENKLIPRQDAQITFCLDSDTPNLNIKFVAKEIDPISDDIGQQELNLDTIYSGTEPQHINLTIVINGSGRGERNLKATLDLRLSITRSTGLAQIMDIEPNGWAIAKTASGVSIPLAANTAVAIKSIKEGREHFEIIEGPHKGSTASIALDKSGGTHLCQLPPRSSASLLKLFLDRWVLQIAGLGDFSVLKLTSSDMIFPGTYKICLPDAPHQGGRRLRSKARHAESWFRIGDDGDRYIHPGSRSKGCITLTDISKWESIYAHLSGSRLDDLHVGILEVV